MSADWIPVIAALPLAIPRPDARLRFAEVLALVDGQSRIARFYPLHHHSSSFDDCIQPNLWMTDDRILDTDKVSHWMPLPEVPAGEAT